jgi:hypothetical protein
MSGLAAFWIGLALPRIIIPALWRGVFLDPAGVLPSQTAVP